MKNIKLWTIISFMAGSLFACTEVESLNLEKEAVRDLYENRDKDKWAEEDALKQKNYEDSIRIAEENERLYELYLEDLREYKKTKHPVMFGWFNGWSSTTPGDYYNLSLLPDSVDIVSIWGSAYPLDEVRLSQLREVQNKGTKVIIGWIIENVGVGIDNRTKDEYSDVPETAVKEYAQDILDSIAKYGYDGFDIDYEPSYASPWKPGNHCGDWTNDWTENKPLISCQKDSNKELENLFFRTLREGLDELEAEDGKERILNINGSIHWLSPEVAPLFNYFVAQSYSGYSGWTGRITDRLGMEVKDRIIYTDSFAAEGEAERQNIMNYANYVVESLDREAGGIGAFHINADVLEDGNYRNVRNAINYMNPAIK